jgi:hypothetical protein
VNQKSRIPGTASFRFYCKRKRSSPGPRHRLVAISAARHTRCTRPKINSAIPMRDETKMQGRVMDATCRIAHRHQRAARNLPGQNPPRKQEPDHPPIPPTPEEPRPVHYPEPPLPNPSPQEPPVVDPPETTPPPVHSHGLIGFADQEAIVQTSICHGRILSAPPTNPSCRICALGGRELLFA